jgi:monoamine oxidase
METFDVLIVGAGAAGLAAAVAMQKAGAHVRVLEARDRVGGRIDTRRDPIDEVPFELGAELVHGKPRATRRIAAEARLHIGELLGARRCYVGGSLHDCSEGFEDGVGFLAAIEGPDEPIGRALQKARARGALSAQAAELAAAFVEGYYAAPANEASAVAIAEMERAGEKIEATRSFRVLEGYDRVPLALLRKLEPGTVALNAVVREIRWKRGSVELHAASRTGFALEPCRARAALITVPVGVLKARRGEPGAIRFVPEIRSVREVLATIGSGPIVKAVLRFRSRFWETEGEQPLGFVHAGRAATPFPTWWTLLPREARFLVGWAAGPAGAALSFAPEAQVLGAAVRSLARLFSRRRSEIERELEAWQIADWMADPFARGGYAWFSAGAADAPEKLARPLAETLFFAGEATHPTDAGTVHGALETGERAAAELLALLRSRRG